MIISTTARRATHALAMRGTRVLMVSTVVAPVTLAHAAAHAQAPRFEIVVPASVPYRLGGFDALVWLRQSAPATSHFRRPLERPEYGIAAEWVWGHWITRSGRSRISGQRANVY